MNEGAGAAIVFVGMGVPPNLGSMPVIVYFATSNGTASAGSDYIATNGTLSFYLNQFGWGGGTVTVPIVDNAVIDGNRRFTLNFSTPPGGPSLVASNRTVTVTIVDNDTCSIVENKPLSILPPIPVWGGAMRVEVHGQTNAPYLLQASTNLSEWLTLQTNHTPSCPLIYYDYDALKHPWRFYRFRLGP